MVPSVKPAKKQLVSQIRKLLKERGTEISDLTKKLMLEDIHKVECKEVRDALRYFARKYWSDLARPTLMTLACEAVGGNSKDLTEIAVSMMLLAGGVDIHDDIIDQSATKNGRLTVYGKFGKDIALLIGDALMFKGFTRLQLALNEFPANKSSKVLRILEDTFFELGDAEALEFRLKARLDADPIEYLRIIRKKAADVEAYTHISALLSNGTKEEIDALRHYGRILGMLAVLSDDVADTADEEELMHRLENEVAPLPVLFASQVPSARSAINSLLSGKKRTKADVAEIVRTTKQGGGFAQTEKQINELVDEGISSLKSVKHKQGDLALLISVAKAI